jgi:adhesin/invasin
MNSAGQASIPTTTANTVAGAWNMTASAPGGTPSKTIPRINNPGAPSSVSLALNPTSIVANGTSHSTATATVKDSFGNKIPGQSVTMSATGPTVGPVTGVGDGTYTAQLTSSTTAGNYSVTATDTTPNPDIVSSPATLAQTAGPADHITVPAEISATVGNEFTSQTIIVSDQFGNPVNGKIVSLATPETGASGTFPGGVHSDTVTTNISGMANLPVTTANTVAGPWEMTASISGGPANTLSRTNLPGPANSVDLTLEPGKLRADGTAQTTATAQVADAFGNPVAGDTVSLSASGSQAVGSVTDHGDGTYSSIITATTTPGTYTVTATDTTPTTPVASNPVTLEQTVLPATDVKVTLAPASLPADGTSKSTATVSVTNELGNPVSGEEVTVTSNGVQKIGAAVESSAGVYKAEIVASTVVGKATITAVDSSPRTPVSGSAELTQTSVGPPPGKVIKPVLRFKNPPKRKIRSAKVKFRFRVVKGEARGFQCRLDRRKWKKCKSPKRLKLKPGKHVFRVRGIATDGSFGKPISRKIKRVKRVA